jgi:predicted  nucleic acid-binding Zn-ribbon protein
MEDWSRQDLVNEINWLQRLLDRRLKRSREMRNNIMKLEDELKESKRLNTQNRNKINRLEADLASVEDFSDKQAEVIKHYFNQIKGLVNGRR